MPVEIRELVIRSEVVDERQPPTNATVSSTITPQEKEKLILTCIERVFEALKKSKQK